MELNTALQKYNFLQRNPDTGGLEMFLDHHSMSSFRMCPAKFELEILNNIHAKGRQWSLEFGIVFHKMIENMLLRKRDGKFDVREWLGEATILWAKANLDEFLELPTPKALGGMNGFVILLAQYEQFYRNEIETLRPIGVEIAFGKAREVPLGSFNSPSINAFLEYDTVTCYLTGRIDFLMDSGRAIGPLDHKTAAWFKGDMTENHDPQEGMTGYVYAASKIIKSKYPELAASKECNRVWMNYVQVKAEADFNKRFKRMPIFKTEWQLEEWRLRQIQTMKGILGLILSGDRATWNTSVCTNTFHKKCDFHRVHRQNSPESMLTILKNDYEVREPWNPERND